MLARQMALLPLLAVAHSVAGSITAWQVKDAIAAATGIPVPACVSSHLICSPLFLTINIDSILGFGGDC
jgi:hypothetical protein